MILAVARIACSIALVASVLAGCTTSGAGRRVGGLLSRSPPASAPYIAALQGGIVARSGVEMSKNDQQRALEAEYRALEAAPGGQPVLWKGSGVSGQVVASAPYQVGSQNCRQYTHTVTTEEREAKARGAACRNENGTWTPLS